MAPWRPPAESPGPKSRRGLASRRRGGEKRRSWRGRIPGARKEGPAAAAGAAEMPARRPPLKSARPQPGLGPLQAARPGVPPEIVTLSPPGFPIQGKARWPSWVGALLWRAPAICPESVTSELLIWSPECAGKGREWGPGLRRRTLRKKPELF